MERKVHVIDADGKALGRIATEVARYLMGKHKTTYVPNADAGDFVHVKHAAKLKMTGRKREQKVYRWYTGYQGGLREKKASRVAEENPAELVERAVDRMLPKNTFRTARLRRMRVTN